MQEIKCSCGHINPYGTEVCGSCGKPLSDTDSDQLLNMRYEGAARRSQTYNKTIIDKIWNFFSSVKVGIAIIVITLIASSIGTIFPQEMFIPPGETAAQFYAEEHGALGQLYYSLGLHNLYGSWWYMLLVAALGTSIIIASIDRFFPLYKALKSQRVTRHKGFMKRQRIFGTSHVDNVDETMDKAQKILKDKRYNIRTENGNLLAEKNRWARWGPYVNHIGLIVFLVGASLRFFPDMYIDENLWVREGQTEVIPGTSGEYYVENEAFTVEYHEQEEGAEEEAAPLEDTFRTDAVLYQPEEGGTVGVDQELEEIDRQAIEVNDAFHFDDYSLYQVDYKLDELREMSFDVEDTQTGETVGSFTVDLNEPDDDYELENNENVRIHSYFPNFNINEEGVPTTENDVPDNPGFIFEMENSDTGDMEHTFVGVQANYNVSPNQEDNRYVFEFAGLDTNHVTGLTVRKDNTLPFLIVGGAIFMIGLVQGSYWPHRRIWLQRKDGEVWLAGHTNKNWESLKKDIHAVTEETQVTTPRDQTDEDDEQTAEKDENI
ncbi:cytochrome c biogenesis protein ResB [Salicibibacter cibarius]|uniref:Cytochrome c biogenesis protein ResB n=1 Tax=Salicibibacter cibarius TaxID=2743000 RepID=A0A7T7CBG9_9BACI|nr:cytochrome c biogenesis protein ResB [Salicibibacter cibarius]QQK75974.1 cytochrome c biogenesis protein ResB [Salicibibacter cibarius]